MRVAGASAAARPPLLIVACSARGLAAAAASAWQPWVIDAFGDADTRALASHCVQLETDAELRFNAAALAAALEALPLTRPETLPIVIGSGFEHAPALLDGLAARGHLLGCGAAIFRRLQDMPAVLAELAASGEVRVPETVVQAPAVMPGWLVKSSGCSGGFHVRAAAADDGVAPGRYYQACVPGPSCSALFVATRTQCRLYGVTRHLAQRPRAAPGYQYQGAEMLPGVAPPLAAALARSGAAVARTLGLRGGFGIDFLLREDGEAVVVDINPRLTATLDVYSDRAALFAAHVAACRDDVLDYRAPPSRPQRAQFIVYAPHSLVVPDRVDWPAEAADVPCAGTRVAAGSPLLSLVAEGHSIAAARARLTRAARAVLRRIGADSPTIDIVTMGGSADVSAGARYCL